ncbi:MAG: NifB/NifX family molybdenum-iron cluster-binding protein [Clostridiales bacterium]|nr:NifB/NifX family molybdenum-iron cluster-binding protein [Clostridiales bacterium]MCF8021388.1 NifB/NifX family molybdenum-iron cluster-binding protein [Clostridiales bacterium]
MKVALPIDGENINQHYGKSKEFVIWEVEGQNVKEDKVVSTVNLAHNHEGLANLFKTENVEVIILGGIGPPALQALEESGLIVITGAEGTIRDIVELYAQGNLESRYVSCDKNHGRGYGNDSHGCH